MRNFAPPVFASLGLSLVLASCVGPAGKPVTVPAAIPATPVPAPVPPVPPVPAGNDWTLRAATPGNWTYRAEAGGSLAQFGSANRDALLTVRCEKASRRIHVMRAGAGTGPMTVRTSYGAVNWPATPVQAETVAIRSASDAALDQIAYSRGRFAIEVAGLAPLILPAWAEVARTIEDCRD